MKTIKLSNCEVEIKDERLTWGENEMVRFSLLDIAKGTISAESQMDSRSKRMEYGILSIKENGKVIPYSKKWLMSLSQEDGEILAKEFDDIDSKKNIKSPENKLQEESDIAI